MVERPPALRSAELLKEMMAAYYARGAQARASGIPVAWVTAVFPVEIVYAMGLFPYYPENFGAMAATRRVADQLSRHAEARGYFNDLCGYARCGLGDSFSAEHPVGALERPDVIFSSNTQCGSLAKWFQAASHQYGVPYFLLDSPYIVGERSANSKEYFEEQLREMIAFLENMTGRPMDYGRLREVLELSNEACRLWNAVLDTAALTPAPFGFFDACVHMFPIVTWRGTPEAVTYYRALLEELQERHRAGLSAVPGERFKIYWDHIPVWPRLRYFSDYFAARGALVACSQYTHSWAWRFDPAQAIESMAQNYAEAFVNRDYETRLQLKTQLMRRYRVHGFVLLSNRSCKPNSFGLYDKQKELTKRTGLPGVVIEADMADLRFFAQPQVEERLEAFFDQLVRTKFTGGGEAT